MAGTEWQEDWEPDEAAAQEPAATSIGELLDQRLPLGDTWEDEAHRAAILGSVPRSPGKGDELLTLAEAQQVLPNLLRRLPEWGEPEDPALESLIASAGDVRPAVRLAFRAVRRRLDAGRSTPDPGSIYPEQFRDLLVLYRHFVELMLLFPEAAFAGDGRLNFEDCMARLPDLEPWNIGEPEVRRRVGDRRIGFVEFAEWALERRLGEQERPSTAGQQKARGTARAAPPALAGGGPPGGSAAASPLAARPLAAGTWSASAGSLHACAGTGRTTFLSRLSTHPSMPKFTFGARVLPGKPENNPGVGSYEAHLIGGERHSKFKQQPCYAFGGGSDRFGAIHDKGIAEPGQYGVPDNPGKYKASSRSGFGGAPRGPVVKCMHVTAGPGMYTLKSTLGASCPAYTVQGKRYRRHVQSLLRPGPGSYDPSDVVDSKFATSAKVGFGTSLREDLHAKHVRATPGPGAYEHKGAQLEDCGRVSLVPRRRSHNLESYLTPGPGMYDSNATLFGD